MTSQPRDLPRGWNIGVAVYMLIQRPGGRHGEQEVGNESKDQLPSYVVEATNASIEQTMAIAHYH